MDLPLPRERSQGSWALDQIGTSADIIMVVMMMVIIASILGKWRRELKDGGGRKRICGGDKRGAPAGEGESLEGSQDGDNSSTSRST